MTHYPFAKVLMWLLAPLTLVAAPLRAADVPQQTVTVGAHDIGGVVTSPHGPEAGVWVIAETTGLPTKFTRIVVTDDAGRYLIPDLPAAGYTVWVRGYGLIDSAKTQSVPGKALNLKAVIAPDAKSAAAYYPAVYWFSMLNIPDKSQFPGTGVNGNGIATTIKSQEEYLEFVKTDGCYACHQLGDAATRTFPKSLEKFGSSADTWERRVQSGQASSFMVRLMGQLGQQKATQMFADWTDRIAGGELPSSQPQRPQGAERNIVVTLWDWADAKTYLHDEISTDRRNPTVNAYGPIYGSTEESTPSVPILDPVHNTKSHFDMQVRDPETPSSIDSPILASSPYWGDEPIWNAKTSMHNPMLDEKGRVWITTKIRPSETSAFCREGSSLPSAKLYPIKASNRQVSMYDPATKKITLIDLCFGTHHLQFAPGADNMLWFSGSADVAGWFNRRIFEQTGDEQKAQGWSAFVLDTNGNGKRDDYVEPKDALDPKKDKRISAAFYGVAPNPVDGSVWGSSLGYPGLVLRVVPGANPPETTLTEVYEAPASDPKAKVHGYSPRGMDIDHNGVVWTSLASGHLASFDRGKCKGPLNGPAATGKQCPEGWTLYRLPGPQFKGVDPNGSAEASYYTWVDQFDTLGLGKNVPIATGNANDALLALVDGKFVTLRVPYPMGFFAKGLDGRIDDANAGWKGRGLWATYGTRTPFHMEGGKGTLPKVVHFQIRPNPLAD